MITECIGLKENTITDWIEPGASVLELGCGNGELLSLIREKKQANARGIEIDSGGVRECVRRGLDVLHENADEALADYGVNAFDYVIFNDSLQRVVIRPELVINEALRVGKKVIVAVPNFAHIRSRFQIFFRGRTPVTDSLPYEWYNTPNLHFLSIKDFTEFLTKRGIKLVRSDFVGKSGRASILPNLFALTGIFLISK